MVCIRFGRSTVAGSTGTPYSSWSPCTGLPPRRCFLSPNPSRRAPSWPLRVSRGVAAGFLLGPGWMWLVLLALFTGGLLVVGGRYPAATSALASAIATVCVTALLVIAGSAAVRHINAVAARDFPDDRVIDHVLSPIPTNPFCWDVLLLETHGDRYIARHGMLSEAP